MSTEGDDSTSIAGWLEGRRVRIAPVDESGLIGIGHALDTLRSVAARLRHPGRAGIEVPRGIILAGAPGTGKTLAARWFGGLLGPDVPAYDLPADVLTPDRVREAFAHLGTRPRSVVYMPEIDAVGMAREWGGHDRESRKTMYALLEAIDGLQSAAPDQGAVIVATTNRARSLDPALTRHGRLGITVVFRTPDAAERRRLLQVYLRDRPADPVDLVYLSELLTDATPAAIRGVVDAAHGTALDRDGDAGRITQDDLVLAVRRAGTIDHEPDERRAAVSARRTAVHEAAHAVVAVRLGLAVRSIRIAIGGREGLTVTGTEGADADDARLRATVVVAMAGIAGERVLLGEPGTGAGADVAHATRLLLERIGSGTDPMVPPTDRRAWGDWNPRIVDEALSEHVGELLARARDQAHAIVLTERDAIERLAQRLVDQPVLAGDALRDALVEAGVAGPSIPPITEAPDHGPLLAHARGSDHDLPGG